MSIKPTKATTTKKKPASKAGKAPARKSRDTAKSDTAKRVGGRPTAFRSEHSAQARKLCLLGATDADLADFFGVGEATINRWKLAHPEFRESIKSGKMDADANVAESLYRAAIGGGTLTDTKEQADADGKVTRTKEVRQVQASVTAMIFWLKNRQPDKWRDRIEHQADVTLTSPDGEALLRLYDDRMQQARARQDAVKRERGLVDDADGQG
ncbi:MAG: hypothetical protein WA056_01605 [Gallionella sp.]